MDTSPGLPSLHRSQGTHLDPCSWGAVISSAHLEALKPKNRENGSLENVPTDLMGPIVIS